jgi:hypothetical protein
MKIGVIVYSQTGHTLEVAQRLQESLVADGHAVDVERVRLQGDRTPQTKTFTLDCRPDTTPYEVLVFASYVEAFSLCPVMKAYLVDAEGIRGKPCACLVTQQFPYAWLGGTRSVRQMKELCRRKGATPVAGAVVHWAQAKREASIVAVVDELTRAFRAEGGMDGPARV